MLFQSIILQVVREVQVDRVRQVPDKVKDLMVTYGANLLTALLTLIIGWYIIKVLINGLNKLMLARDVDPSLRPFLNSIFSIGLKIMLLLTVASMLGIQTTSFIAALGAAGLAIGLALQGSLSNFAGGVLILLFKPFRVGDVIEAQGHRGAVQEIQILYTILNTVDNKKVVIPNGNLSNNAVINFTAHDNRRIDLIIAIAYGSNVEKVRLILQEISLQDERILQEPAPVIGVQTLGEYAIHLVFNFWVKREDFLFVTHAVNEKVQDALRNAGIEMTVLPRIGTAK